MINQKLLPNKKYNREEQLVRIQEQMLESEETFII
jgi:hypothetical protein